MAKNGKEAIEFAKKLVGRPYVLGANVKKDNPDYAGAFDCAEFVAFTNYQVFGILYGCSSNSLQHVATADAYTGYFGRDAESIGKIISVEEATQIPGAMLLRKPSPGATGHIAFSEGTGETVEANCTKFGCIESTALHRRWDYGILLNGVDYDQPDLTVQHKEPAIVYRLKTPNMVDPFIKKIQTALGFEGEDVDGIFGRGTSDAVIAFQKGHGLIVDGEVMPGGETARNLGVL